MVALLMFAAGFALGLFFGWLLHRERVERAVYEDVARNRDRATAALAETSARLELANKDMIRLRSQLTDVEHELDDRNAAIAELRQRAVAAGQPDVDAAGQPDVDAAGQPDADAGADAAGALDAEDRADVTAEVALAATRVDGAAAAPVADDAEVGPTPSPSPGADASETPAAGEADRADAAPTGVQERLATLLDVDPEPAAPEDDTGGELSSTAQDAAGVAVTAEPDDPPSAEPGPDAVERTDEPEPPVADPRAGSDELSVAAAEPVVTTGDAPAGAVPLAEEAAVVEPDALVDDPLPPPPRDEPVVREPEAPPGRPDPADAIEPTPIAPEPVGADASPVDASPVDASPVDAPDDDETTPAAVTPVAVATDGAVRDPGATDDLRLIAGVGPALERALHAEGITTFDQIAALDDAAIADLAGRQPRLVSRLRRDGWVAQARRLQGGARRPE